jgi:hypothetical protein
LSVLLRVAAPKAVIALMISEGKALDVAAKILAQPLREHLTSFCKKD